MRTRILQDWVTVQLTTVDGPGGVSSVTQDQEGWLDVSSFAAATFEIDVASVSTPGSPTNIQLALQTSPTLDETYFVACTPVTNLVQSSSPLVVQTLRLPTTVPLARFLRWKVAASNPGTNATWSVTFRIRASFSLESFFVPTDVPGCALWLRADLGITLDPATFNNVVSWADQSGNGNVLSQAVSANQPTYNTTDPGYGGAPSLAFSTSTSPQWLATATGTPNIPQPYTVFLVTTYTGSAGSLTILFGENATGRSVPSYWASTGVWGAQGNVALLSTSSIRNQPVVYGATLNGASSIIYVQSSTNPVGTGNVGTGSLYGYLLGVYADMLHYGYNGTVAEVLAYAGVPSAWQRSKLFAYFNRYQLGAI